MAIRLGDQRQGSCTCIPFLLLDTGAAGKFPLASRPASFRLTTCKALVYEVTAELTLTEGTYRFRLLGIWAIHRVLGCCLATTKANEVLARFLHRLLWLRVVLSFR